ncbi:amidohydrolase family protein [Pseudarthrobacter sp. J75]|uniref:amidohydrolase n=1 Tax=unclassified Pseudarthrobacter TaxID=2647000 RepID=UPI002E82267D|nr:MULTISPECIES: amidohydrolase family protein [unclassified Pseudarthrobacter]MEE2524603.1 amidohydrolase family protein [Pseudarthrobacter sp. J47]MEE2530120.1 amidohydrolase family protein [Pseudarthrobacter sp. J75]MEE2570406.1 amidohydrolase family protein [Pseudarthrobacter sp. J64]
MKRLLLTGARLPGRTGLWQLETRDGVVAAISPGLTAGGRVNVESVNLGGRHVIPGLWDEHVHLTQWALAANRIDLSGAASAREAAAAVGAAVGSGSSSGTEITTVGVGFRDALWADLPTLEMLDAETGHQPTALISHDLHCVWLNSAAAGKYGAQVDATGLLREEPAFILTRELGRLPDSVIDGWVQDAARAAAARGVVGVVDFEMTWNRDPWLRRIGAGFDALRVDAGVYPEDLERAQRDGMRSGQEIDGGNGLLRVGPLKVLIDGSLNTRTAYCVDPYPHGGHGLLTVSEDELVALLERAREWKFLPAVHAIGDAANQVALDAFEQVGVRGRIEHAQFVRREDLPRFAALGVTASVQPVHALDDRDAAESNWNGRTDRAFPLRSLLDAGAALALGSDAPVAPLDPWAAISAATTRARNDGRAPWHPEEAITRVQALAASARGRGSIGVGDPADLVILDADPLTTPDADVATMPVAGTMLGGRWTFDGGLP